LYIYIDELSLCRDYSGLTIKIKKKIKGSRMKFVRLLLVSLVMSAVISTNFLLITVDANSDMAEFVKGKNYQQGYFSFYNDKKNGKVYLAIDKFEQQFLFQSSLPYGIGSNDIGLDRGQLGDTRLVQFERVGDKVFLRQLNSYYRADSNNVLEKQAVEQAFASSIIWGFSIAQSDNNSDKVLIDYTPFLLSDIHHLSQQLKSTKQGSFKVDASRSGVYNKRTKAFPNNTELEAIVTYTGSDAGKYLRSVSPDANAISVHLRHSLIKLPDNNYNVRMFHPFSGFFAMEYADYAAAIDQPLIKRLITRHRLAKKNPQAKKSVAIKSIIYYLDAGVPEPIRSALMDGAKWWNQAFSEIGYQEAFQVKILPADADPMDVRYNVIQWVHRATRGWSYGSSVTDPRTGEIIKGHVTLGSLRVRQDYLIALGLTSPFKGEINDTSAMKNMALARIRQLAAHEVGHTLGLAHNFAASVDDRASVMDYPHPLITIKQAKSGAQLDLSKAYAENIGNWDKYTIAYGYGDLQTGKEQQQLQALVRNGQAQGFKFISDADARPKSGANADAHLWDNGKNAALELERVLKVRQIALEHIGLNSIPLGTPLSELEQVLAPIYNFHRYQVEAAVKLLAGVNYSYAVKGDAKVEHSIRIVETVGAKTQRQALTALLKTLNAQMLTLPKKLLLLIPPKAYGFSRNRESLPSKTGVTFDAVTLAQASAEHTISLLLNKSRLARLAQQSALNSAIPSVAQLFEQLLRETVYKPAKSGLQDVIQQRINQAVVKQLLTLWLDKTVVTEVRSEVLLALTKLEKSLQRKTKISSLSKRFFAHYRLLIQQINYGLHKGKPIVPMDNVNMPPGSPIGS
jgi:uncharacterized protein DUF4953/uncharacterized protein DUF5117